MQYMTAAAAAGQYIIHTQIAITVSGRTRTAARSVDEVQK